MYGACGVRNCALGMSANINHGFQRGLQVAHIIHGIEHPEYIDPAVMGALHKPVTKSSL